MSGTHSTPDPWQQESGQPPFGGQPSYGQQPYGQPPYGSQQPYGYPGQPQQATAWGQQATAGWWQAPRGPRRPGSVLASAIMTYVGAGFMALIGIIMLIGAAVSDAFVRGGQEAWNATSGMTTTSFRLVALGFGGFALLLGAALIVLAVFAQWGRNGARIGLTVIGAIEVIASLFSVVRGSGQSVLGLVYVAVAVILLWVGTANAWYRAQRAARRR